MAQVPLTRRFIETALAFDHGFNPVNVTEALDDLAHRRYKLGGLTRSKLAVGEAAPIHVFSIDRRPTLTEEDRLRALYELRRSTLTPPAVKAAGEQYVAGLLRRTDRWKVHRLPLGEAATSVGKPRLDLLITERSTGIRYGVSVKNIAEYLTAGGSAGQKSIRDVISRSKANGVRPMLVAPFATRDFLERCRRDGVAFLALRAQILPSEAHDGRHMRLIVRELRPVFGSLPVKFQPAPRAAISTAWSVHLKSEKLA